MEITRLSSQRFLMESDYLPHNKFSRFIDNNLSKIGEVLSWIWLALMVVVFFNVVLRYGFNQGRIELEELQWHLYSIGFLIGLSYTYVQDKHIRVDIFHEKFTPQRKAWVELYGILLFLLPFLALVIVYSIPFISSSYAMAEISPSPGGLPLRWLIKSSLLLGFCLLLISSLARISRIWSFLFLEEEHAN